MASTAAKVAWRFPTPSLMILCGIFLFLPWINVNCKAPAAKDPGGAAAAGNPFAGSPLSGEQTLLTQSGFQTITGEFSEGDTFKQFSQMGRTKTENKKQSKTKDKAVFLIPYAAMLVITAVLGFTLTPGTSIRKTLMCLFAGMATVFLAVQLVMGFPAEKEIKDRMAQKPTPGVNRIEPDVEMYTARTPWPWVSVGLCGVAVVLSIVEAVAVSGNGRRKWEGDGDPAIG